jgi:hypothetical protein
MTYTVWKGPNRIAIEAGLTDFLPRIVNFASLHGSISSGTGWADTDVDGTYTGTSVGSGRGNCDSTTISSTVRAGVLYDNQGVPHGRIREGATLSWEAATKTLHIPETITAQLLGDTIRVIAIEHGGPNCTWKTEQKKVRKSPLSSSGACVQGCKGWIPSNRTIDGKPYCVIQTICPEHPTSPPDDTDKAPVVPPPR